MNLLKFWEVPFLILPFCAKINDLYEKGQFLYCVTSDDDKKLEITVIINKKMLEITKYFELPIKTEVFLVNKEGLQFWSDRKRKVYSLKSKAEISSSKSIIESISAQIKIQRKYTNLTSAERREIFRVITEFEKNVYSQNIIDVDINMSLGKQNHWLD